MKIAGGRITGFIGNPDPTVRAVLVYGPDQGLVRERAHALVAAAADDPSDPFRVIELTMGAVKGDPACLVDEAASLSFTGGRRVVRIREASDAAAEAFKALLATSTCEALVVVEAGQLAPRSALRQLFETAANAAAVACYVDSDAVLSQVISETLADHGLAVTPEAIAFLAANLGSDRAVTRSELEKLALYMGGSGTVKIEDAAAAVGDNGIMSIDSTIYAACGGEPGALDRLLARALSEGIQPVSLLRAAGRHLQRLHLARSLIDKGRSPDQAMMALKPPVFQGLKDRFRDQVRRWNSARLAIALEIVTEAELDCKTTGKPADAVCSRALMRLAQAARSSRDGR
jgi:DNA polymerase III subunit delta